MITPTEWTSFKLDWLDQVMLDADLPASAFKVAYCIIKHCNMSSESGWPSLRRIAEKTRLRKATVIEAVPMLEANGHLKIDYGKPGRGCSNYYTPILKGPESVPFGSNATASEKVRKPDLRGTKTLPQRSGKRTSRGTKTGPEHLTEHLQVTPSLNTVRPSAAPANAVQQAKKKVEQDLTTWIADSLIDEQTACSIRTAIGDLIDACAAEEDILDDADAAYAKISRAIESRRHQQPVPSGPAQSGYPMEAQPIVIPEAEAPPLRPESEAPDVSGHHLPGKPLCEAPLASGGPSGEGTTDGVPLSRSTQFDGPSVTLFDSRPENQVTTRFASRAAVERIGREAPWGAPRNLTSAWHGLQRGDWIFKALEIYRDGVKTSSEAAPQTDEAC
jgi:hypothetical protein